VDRLLGDGSKGVSYAEETPLNRKDIDALIERYRRTPSASAKAGIAKALAHQGDDRVVALFWNTLTKEFAGRRFQESKQDTYEWSNVAHLVSLHGLLARRSEKAYDVLENGVQPSFWQTNVTWSIHNGQSPTHYLVGESINGLATCARDDAWQVILNLKTKSDSAYLKAYSSAIVDAAYLHYSLTNHGIVADTGDDILTAFIAWENDTPDGQAWHQWYYKITGIDENMMRHRPKSSPAPMQPGTK